ncbi:MAG: hypothetical protein LIP77_08245 [Planctomycetes bacterium]|nr:hypothetical protein [Planctomycetota bacterium]
MADPKKRRSPARTFVVFLVVYAAGYGGLRASGEIVSQTARVQVESAAAVEYLVGSDPLLPRWRRQAYRTLFSPLMVVEEEVHRSGGVAGLVRNTGDFFRDIFQI